jgi:hypothetical protein
MDVRLPDGTVIKGVPDGTTKAQLAEKLKANGMNVPADWMGAQKPERQPVQQFLGNLGAGAIRGAGSIGATLLTPYDLLRGNTKSLGNPERRADMDAALQELGADTGSVAYGAGKLGAEVAGTLGAGGAIANTAARVPMVARNAAPVLEAVRTAGFSTGLPAATTRAGAAGNLALRATGGGVTGAASAGLVNPEDARTGGMIGAALPPALAAGAKVGQAVGGAFRGRDAKTGADLARALELQDPQAVQAAVQALRQAQTLVPGSRPTVAQALQSPQAGILERVVSDSAGGVALKNAQQAQNAARLAALEGVAPVNPLGFATAQQETGEALARFAQAELASAKSATRAAYQSVPQDEAALYLPDLAQARNEFFPPGSFTTRDGVDRAVKTANEIGFTQVPGVVATKVSGPQPLTLAQAVRKAGGLNLMRNDGRGGELKALRESEKNLVFVNSGVSPSRMAEQMHEAGYIPENTIDSLIDSLKNNAGSSPIYSKYDPPEKAWRAAYEAQMGGGAQAAEAIPRKVTLREFDALRKSIGSVQRGASADPERAAEAAALSKMKQMMDDRVNEVVRGDGKADEVLPIAWADALDQARRLKLGEVERFMTGPQAAIFRKGSDGQPLVQGGEVAAKFWGGAGQADKVKSLRKLIDDNPRLLGQFREMVATEGASTATNAGNITGKFAKWVDSRLPGLKEAFTPDQVRTLQNIAQDIKRAEAAAAAGMSRGSNTYQNAQNALNLGLIDNPMVSAAAGRIPYLGGAVDWMRNAAKEGKARRLAGVLSDSELAANALMQQAPRTQMSNALMNPELQRLILRGAPIAGSDR